MSTDPHHHEHEVPLEGKNPIKCVISSPSSSSSTPQSPAIIFTHGAGGTLHSEGILNFRTAFARHSPITCFQGSMNLPSRIKMFDALISHQSSAVTALGGRSMGARAAIMAAKDREEVKALVLVSYPLHTDKGDVRDEILMGIEEGVKVLFVVGDRDGMCGLGRLEEVRGRMKARSWLVKVEGADHGMSVKPKFATKVVGELVGKVAAEWLKSLESGLDGEKREGKIWWDEDEKLEKWSGWEVNSLEAEISGKDQTVVKEDNVNPRKTLRKPKPLKKGKAQTKVTEPQQDAKRRGKRSSKTQAEDEELKIPARKRRKA